MRSRLALPQKEICEKLQSWPSNDFLTNRRNHGCKTELFLEKFADCLPFFPNVVFLYLPRNLTAALFCLPPSGRSWQNHIPFGRSFSFQFAPQLVGSEKAHLLTPSIINWELFCRLHERIFVNFLWTVSITAKRAGTQHIKSAGDNLSLYLWWNYVPALKFSCGSPMRAYRLYHMERLFVKRFWHTVAGKAAAVSDSRRLLDHLTLFYTTFFFLP